MIDLCYQLRGKYIAMKKCLMRMYKRKLENIFFIYSFGQMYDALIILQLILIGKIKYADISLNNILITFNPYT